MSVVSKRSRWVHADGGRYVVVALTKMHVHSQVHQDWRWVDGVTYMSEHDYLHHPEGEEYTRQIKNDFLLRFKPAP